MTRPAKARPYRRLEVEALGQRILLATGFTWVGAGGGGDGVSWKDAGNWAGGPPGAYPGSGGTGDQATINLAADLT
jgi:hypothetical protein